MHNILQLKGKNMENIFKFKEQSQTITPQLIINRKQLEQNIDHAIDIAGSADRLWPHVKTHKTGAIIAMMVEKGINKFKCATIAEAEMSATFGARKILLAYPAVGPNIKRFLDLCTAFPHAVFFCLFDDFDQLASMDEECRQRGTKAKIMVDVNVGMNRTGVAIENIPNFFERCSSLENVILEGLHCYDGHRHESNVKERKIETEKTYKQVMETVEKLKKSGYLVKDIIMGGTPSFPCYAAHDNVFLSPGTVFLNDAGYTKNYQDLVFQPAAAILTRVISNPCPGHFTLDLGYKGIASDPEKERGVILDLDNTEELFQSEEHWAWKMKDGHESECPKVGDELFVIPTHICPTSALYPFSVVVENGCKVAEYEITARNRKITY